MAKRRLPPRLHIVGMIEDEQYQVFSEALDELERAGEDTVYVDIRSEGGDSQTALAYFSRIRLSPCCIVTTAYGTCSSAAVLVLAAGETRRMTKESWVMVHEEEFSEECSPISGSMDRVEKDVKQYRAFEDQWVELLEQATGVSSIDWSRLHKDETYLTPKECLRLNLIHEIV